MGEPLLCRGAWTFHLRNVLKGIFKGGQTLSGLQEATEVLRSNRA